MRALITIGTPAFAAASRAALTARAPGPALVELAAALLHAVLEVDSHRAGFDHHPDRLGDFGRRAPEAGLDIGGDGSVDGARDPGDRRR